MIGLLLLLAACGSTMIAGRITADATGDFADVDGVAAFGYDAGGQMLVYISSNPAATCDGVSGYLSQPSGTVFDPSDILVGGKCNLTFPVSGFGGDYSANSTDDVWASVSTVIECAMGEGDFELGSPQEGHEDYYWTGTWWQGHATEFDWNFSGGGGSELILDIEMSAYDGNFIYDSTDEILASGVVQGTVKAEWCPGLADSWAF